MPQEAPQIQQNTSLPQIKNQPKTIPCCTLVTSSHSHNFPLSSTFLTPKEEEQIHIQDPTPSDLTTISQSQKHMQVLHRGNKIIRLFNSTAKMYNQLPREPRKRYKQNILIAKKSVVIAQESGEDYECLVSERVMADGLAVFKQAVRLAEVICKPLYEDLWLEIEKWERVCVVEGVCREEGGGFSGDGDSPVDDSVEDLLNILVFFDEELWSSSEGFLLTNEHLDRLPLESEILQQGSTETVFAPMRHTSEDSKDEFRAFAATLHMTARGERRWSL